MGSVTEINAAKVERGELRFGACGQAWVSCGVGSGIVVCAMAPQSAIAAMSYALMPECIGDAAPESRPHFIDTAVEELLFKFEGIGIGPHALGLAYAGAAVGSPTDSIAQKLMNLGTRNQQAIEAALVLRGFTAAARHVGGTCARTVRFDTSSGRVTVAQAGLGESVLCDFRAPGVAA